MHALPAGCMSIASECNGIKRRVFRWVRDAGNILEYSWRFVISFWVSIFAHPYLLYSPPVLHACAFVPFWLACLEISFNLKEMYKKRKWESEVDQKLFFLRNLRWWRNTFDNRFFLRALDVTWKFSKGRREHKKRMLKVCRWNKIPKDIFSEFKR